MARVVLHRPRLSRPVLWAGLCVVAAAVTVQITRTGVDVLSLMVAGFILLLLERTLGDWIADNLGPATTAFVFACVAATGVLYSMSVGGRAKAQRVFSAAEARGYHTLFFTLDEGKGTEDGDGSAVSGAVRGAGDAMRPTGKSRTGVPPMASSPAPGPPIAQQPALTGGSSGGSRSADRSPGSGAPGPPVVYGVPSGSPTLGGTDEDQVESGPLRIFRLVLNPEVVMTGDRVILRAQLSGRSDGPALVEFSIDGHTVSTAPVGRDGIAKASFSTRAPGQYTVRARIVGGPMRITEVSALLTVLVGRV